MKSSLQPELRRFLAKLSRPGCCFNSDPPGGCSLITLAPKKLIRTRRASEGSASEPSLARRVSMC